MLREFKSFLKDWQKFYTVSPEFKIVIADMQTFLHDLRLWLEQVELGIQALAGDRQKNSNRQATWKSGGWSFRLLTRCMKNWRPLSENIGEELRPAHRLFAQRQLHSLMLCFAFRASRLPETAGLSRAITRWST